MPDKPQQLPVKTSAIAIYDILMTIKNTKVSPIFLHNAWQDALEEPYGTSDFARKHSEVVGLLVDAQSEIASIENERVRNRVEKYLNTWWNALIRPSDNWTQFSARDLISDSDLDMLGTACDLISSQRGGLNSTSAASDLASLRAECDEWLSLISDTSEIANDSFREALLTQIKHLVWLIDNADTFGISVIVQRGDQITGALVREAAREGAVKNTGRFRDRINGFVTALTLVANLIHSSQVIYDAADHALPAAEKIIKEITSTNSDHVQPPPLADGP